MEVCCVDGMFPAWSRSGGVAFVYMVVWFFVKVSVKELL